MLIILMFGSMELGNYFLDQHAVTKQVHDGARFASRMTLANPYVCSAEVAHVLADVDTDGDGEGDAASVQIVNVTKTGSVDGSATGRFEGDFWDGCGTDAPLTVTTRCVSKANYGGIYNGLSGDIPVVKISASVDYPSLFAAIGFNSANLCLRASSEAAVAGL